MCSFLLNILGRNVNKRYIFKLLKNNLLGMQLIFRDM